MIRKPMKLSDCLIDKIKYPVLVQCKVDGVRAQNQGGTLYTRTLKPFANLATQKYFSDPMFEGFDGEMYCGGIRDPDLCRKTTSGVNSIQGDPEAKWMVFDLVGSDLPYQERLEVLKRRIRMIDDPRIHLVQWTMCMDEKHLLDLENTFLNLGYEGVVVRTIDGGYKEGRVGKTDPIATRIKRFTEEEAVVLIIEEAEENLNEKQVNELGLSFRTSHQENKIGKGMVGAMTCRDIKTGKGIRVGAGTMPHSDRKMYWENQEELVGKTIKYKCFPHGEHLKPRFPTFVTIRPEWDLA